MTAEEQRNLKVAARYEELYNTDIERFVPECYAPDCEAHVMGQSVIRGHDQFLQVERAVLRVAPKRRMRVDRAHAVGNVVVVGSCSSTPTKDRTGSCRSVRSSPAVTGRSSRIGATLIGQNGRGSKRHPCDATAWSTLTSQHSILAPGLPTAA